MAETLTRAIYDIDAALWREAKMEAVKQGLTVSQYVQLALRLMLKQRKEPK